MVMDSVGLIGLGLAARLAEALGWRINTTAVAATGSAITDAASLSTGYKVHLVTSDGNSKGVILPLCGIGEIQIVKDTAGTNSYKVYPPSTDYSFNGGSGGAAVTIAHHDAGIFIRWSNTDFFATEIGAA